MKKLMPEVLPAPSKAPESPVRELVLKHVRDVMTAGAAVALGAGCVPFGVVDPLPPPAQCKELDTVKGVVTATATEESSPARQIRVVLTTFQWESGVTLRQPVSITGGTMISQSVLGDRAEFTVSPDAGGTSFELLLPATCNDERSDYTRQVSLRVTVRVSATPGGAPPTVELSES
jgi:hypothetical protein